MAEKKESIIRFPMGLLGFENIKEFVFLTDPEEAPFAWLRTSEEPNLSFLVISSIFVSESYNPDINEEDANFLGVKSAEDALVLNIVTLHSDGSATVNLKGPIVINRQTLVAKQVIPSNAADYAIQHPLDVVQG